VLAYGALCRGLLSGKMTRDRKFEGDDLRKVDPKFREPRFSHYLDAVALLGMLARERFGKSVLDLAVRWILDQGPTIALSGARKPHQLDPVADIAGWSLDQASLRAIDAILKAAVPETLAPDFLAPEQAP